MLPYFSINENTVYAYFSDVKRNLITMYNKQLNYSTDTTPKPMTDSEYLNPLFHTDIIRQGKIIT